MILPILYVQKQFQAIWLLKCKRSFALFLSFSLALARSDREKVNILFNMSMFSMAHAYVHVQLQLQAKYINISKLFFRSGEQNFSILFKLEL